MKVLITGGTGSFGQAFARKLLLDPSTPRIERICIYSRDEVKQANMRKSLDDHPVMRWFIGDVRDASRLARAMDGIDVVIHAAALKRIETGAYNPDEMVKTNVLGAMNVIEAAHARKVARVVALSTDKAYTPVSPYGQSKALAESLFINANNMFSDTTFAVTRYGNVAGSTGSVIPTWREILKSSDTVPVTDPECTRFWMTMEQATTLVCDVAFGKPEGKLFIPVLDAYELRALAEAMGAKMEVRGLPPWEKKHECMGEGMCSNMAKRMTVEELRESLIHV
jgi:UDP-N-acetylglucosamine 4,6-dehydratase